MPPIRNAVSFINYEKPNSIRNGQKIVRKEVVIG